MDITAEKYYDDNLENYNLLNKIDPMTAKQAMEMMEGYHQAKLKLLGIGGVSNCDAIFEKASKFPDEDIECDATEADIY